MNADMMIIHSLRSAIMVTALAGTAATHAQILETHWWQPNGTVRTIIDDPVNNVVRIAGWFWHIGPHAPYGNAINTTNGEVMGSIVRPNGPVHAVVGDGNGGWFIGGDFSHVGDTPRGNLARLNSDGSLHAWNPGASHEVRALALTGNILYVGGRFNVIGGQSRYLLAAVDANTGITTGWDPLMDPSGQMAMVSAIAIEDQTVYVGGYFTGFAGQSRTHLAALDASTAALTSWDPQCDGSVLAMVVNGATIYIGGAFSQVGGQQRSRIAELDVVSGLATGWDPNLEVGWGAFVGSLALSGTTLFAGGIFNQVGGQMRNSLAALDINTGLATAWDADVDGIAWDGIRSLVVDGPVLFVGGEFSRIGGAVRGCIAALDIATAQATNWSSDADATVLDMVVQGGQLYAGGTYQSIGGVVRSGIAAIDKISGIPNEWSPLTGSVYALAQIGDTVFAGGSFTSVNGVPRDRLAAFHATTGSLTNWDPGANGIVSAMHAIGDHLVIGGEFTSVGGVPRDRLAVIGPDGNVAGNWTADANGPVRALQVHDQTLYTGGQFLNIGGETRFRFAALDAFTAAVQPCAPIVQGNVFAIAANDETILIGGSFATVDDQPRSRVAAFDAVSCAITTWDPDANDQVNVLAIDGNTVYIGGTFTEIDGQPRSCLAAVDLGTGAVLPWDPGPMEPAGWIPSSELYSIAVIDDKVFIGGYFRQVLGSRRQFFAVVSGVDQGSGIADSTPLSMIAYPNPTDNFVHFDLPDGIVIDRAVIIDALGRQTHQPFKRNDQRYSLDLGQCANGVYIVQLSTAKSKVITSRIIVAR